MKETIDERKHLILVVDDNEDMRIMLAQLLKRAGYQVVLAEDGQTSLTQTKHYHPDLILMDLSLPNISGWEAIELLRKMPAFLATPIIAVTAHVSVADQERALNAGCDVHLGKPFKTRMLLKCIADLLTEKENTHEP